MAEQTPQVPQGLVDVRPAHRFDEAALDRYLAQHLEGYRGSPQIKQFEGGQSNPTFLLSSGDRRYVLRKKPPGTLLPTAHQIERAVFAVQARDMVGGRQERGRWVIGGQVAGLAPGDQERGSC
ncbi:MAG: phosphotransferase, partial [Polyangiales bacterium]